MRSRARAARDSRVCRLQIGNKMMFFFSFLKGDRGTPGSMGQSGPEGGPVRLAYSRRSDSGDGAEKKQEGVGGGGGGRERERESKRTIHSSSRPFHSFLPFFYFLRTPLSEHSNRPVRLRQCFCISTAVKCLRRFLFYLVEFHNKDL